MSEAIVIRAYGDAESLVLEPTTVPDPGAGEIRIRQTAIGVNYHDVYVRSGLYKTLALPGTPGCEAVGIVEAVGADCGAVQVGQRVAYVTSAYGAYASHRLLDAALAVPVPDAVSDTAAASNLLRAMTVDMLVQQVFQVKAGQTLLVHAAAGGVGQLLVQWASHLGAHVIGTVGSEAKAEIARNAGCRDTVLYREVDFQSAVAELTGGRGVDAVFDSVGADTFSGSLEVLAPCGHLINFGQSSGPVEPLLMTTLAAKSLTVSRPILFHYFQDPTRYSAMAKAAFSAFTDGVLTTPTPTTVPLAEAARAHQILESGTGGGSLVLVP